MNTFRRIFLNLNSLNPNNCFFSRICRNFQSPIFRIRFKILRNLIIFWRIWIKIIFSIKLTFLIYFTSQSKCRFYRIIKHFFIQFWQCSWLTSTYWTRRCIWMFVIIIGITRTPYFCICF